MLNKSSILVFVLLIVSVIFIYISWKDIPLITSENTEVLKTKKYVPHKQKISKPSVQQILRKRKKGQENTKIKADVQIVPSVYDDDPVVDANLIIQNNRLCINYLTYKKNKTDKFLQRFEKNLDDKQKAFYRSFYNHCQKINQQHPEYHLSNIKTLKQQKQQAQATSTWGEIIKGEIDVDDLSENEILNLLKQNNLSILVQAPRYLKKYYANVVHWDIEDVLSNHQYDYTRLIFQYAHQLYLCQLGTDCGPNSTIMAGLCYINSRSCGLDYPQFVQHMLSIGQKADLQLALSYLQTIYQ